jgi:hypothetical protein
VIRLDEEVCLLFADMKALQEIVLDKIAVGSLNILHHMNVMTPSPRIRSASLFNSGEMVNFA